MQLRDTANLKVPAARTVDLVTTESKDEVLVYDQTVHHIHHLNATAAAVWRLCDGERTVSEIAAEARMAEDAVKLALRTLEDAQLLDGTLASTMRGTQSRRAFMKKAAVMGSAPVIVSVSAPRAASARSCVGVVACTDISHVNSACTIGGPNSDDCGTCTQKDNGNFQCVP